MIRTCEVCHVSCCRRPQRPSDETTTETRHCYLQYRRSPPTRTMNAKTEESASACSSYCSSCCSSYCSPYCSPCCPSRCSSCCSCFFRPPSKISPACRRHCLWIFLDHRPQSTGVGPGASPLAAQGAAQGVCLEESCEGLNPLPPAPRRHFSCPPSRLVLRRPSQAL